MPRDARFWRNLAVIAAAHIAILIALVRWNYKTRKPNLQSVVWMSEEAATLESQTEPLLATPKPAQADESPFPSEEPATPEPTAVTTTSDILLPVATPPPTPSPTPIASPSPKPKEPVKAEKKRASTPAPKKKQVTKTEPKSSPKKKVAAVEKKKPAEEKKKESTNTATSTDTGSGDKKSGSTEGGTAARNSEFSSYGKMLHDRFFSEWAQPTTSVPTGARMSALVRIRIEKDGRISKFNIVRPSGNVVVDESVAAVAKRVTRVDPLPKGLGGDAFYEVNINFELNPNQ